MPVRRVQETLHTLTGRDFCAEAIFAAGRHVASLAEPVATSIRFSPVGDLDETGWRENGHNGYDWTASISDG